MSPDYICSNCDGPTDMQVWNKDACPTGGWEWLCEGCSAEMVLESEQREEAL